MRKEHHMIKVLFGTMLCLFSFTLQAEKPSGFLWYNVPKVQEIVPTQKNSVPFNKLSYTDRDAVLQFYTMEALHKVRFTHSVEDERAFLALQDYWLREATLHGQINQETLLAYPQYDYSVTHPTSSIGTVLQDSLIHQKQQQAIQKLSKTHGLLFFYRANNPYDQKQLPIVFDFCKRHQLSLVPVSVDGRPSPDLPRSRVDTGQADALGVHFFPAILLVNPKTHETQPVAYGLTTQDVLTQRLVAVMTHFKGVSA
jgi:conjugal transfer pilus assembly protein TraF